VESPDEVTADMVDGCATVGVTAGASTPNWIIAGVVARVVEISDADRLWRRAARWAATWLVHTNVLAGLGAAGLTHAACVLMGCPSWVFPVVSGLYIFAMHTLRFVSTGHARAVISPVAAKLYADRRGLMAVVGIAAAVGCVALSSVQGWSAFTVAALACTAGLLYVIGNAEAATIRIARWRTFRGIPGSKDLFVVMAWVSTTVVLPAVASGLSLDATFWTVVSIVLVFALVRSIFYDVRDMQGDRMVGYETVPILIGKGRTKVLLAALVAFGFLVTGAGCALGVVPKASYGVLGGLAYVCGYLYLYHRRVIFQGVGSEVVVEAGALITAALVAATGAVFA
jgi:4-hydroxy-3-methylbut-2-enyl diphosphate reductase